MSASNSRSTPDGAWAAQTSLEQVEQRLTRLAGPRVVALRAGEVRLSLVSSGGHGDFSGGWGSGRAIGGLAETIRHRA